MSDDLLERARFVVQLFRECDAIQLPHGPTEQVLIGMIDRIEELEAKLRKSALQEMSALGQASEAYQAQLAAEAKLELIQAHWAGAVYGDLETGVASLNAAAATDFYRRYPLVSSFGETLNRIVDGEQDDE